MNVSGQVYAEGGSESRFSDLLRKGSQEKTVREWDIKDREWEEAKGLAFDTPYQLVFGYHGIEGWHET